MTEGQKTVNREKLWKSKKGQVILLAFAMSFTALGLEWIDAGAFESILKSLSLFYLGANIGQYFTIK